MLISVLFVIRNNIHSSFCDLRFGCTLLLVQKWIPSIANFWHFVIRNNFHRSFCDLKFGITLLLVPKWMPSSSNFCLYGTRNNIHSSPAVIAVCKHTPVCSRWITLHFCAFSTMTIVSLAFGVIFVLHAVLSWPKFYHNLLFKKLSYSCSAFVQPVSAVFACANCLVCFIILFVIFTVIYPD